MPINTSVYRTITALAAATGVMLFIGCFLPAEPNTAPLIEIVVPVDTVLIAVGERAKPDSLITVTADGASLVNPRLVYRNRTAGTAEIDSAGNIHGLRRGEPSITVTFISGATGENPPTTDLPVRIVLKQLTGLSDTTLTALNDTLRLLPTYRDYNGNPLATEDSIQAQRDATYTLLTAGDAVEILTDGGVRAKSNGVDDVEVRLDTATIRVRVTVDQQAATLQLTPAPFTFRSLTQMQSFTAAAFDSRGNAIPDALAVWSSRNEAIVEATVDGTATSVAIGATWLDTTVDALTDSVQVVVDQVPRQFQSLTDSMPNATVGTTLATPIEVQLADSLGQSAANEGIVVTFAVTAGGGTLGGQSSIQTTTDASGRASAGVGLTLGTVAGVTNQVTVSSPGVAGPSLLFETVGTPDQPQSLVEVSGNDQRVGISTTLVVPHVVAVTDQYGNGVPAQDVPFAITAGGGNIGGETSVVVPTDSAGEARVLPTIGPTVDDTTRVVATVTGLTGSPIEFRTAGLEPVATVAVTPTIDTAFVGGTAVAYQAQLQDGGGNVLTDRVTVWTTLDQTVATIDQGGLVTGIGVGATAVVATAEGVSDTATVTVLEPVATVVVTPATAVIGEGGTTQLTVELRDQNGTVLNRPVTWTSLAPAVATVTTVGLVQGITAGIAQIEVASEGVADTSSVTVQGPVASVEIQPDTSVLNVGDTLHLNTTIRDAAGNVLTNKTVSWSSDNPLAASINGSGIVSALSSGAVTVTATSDGVNGTAAVFVVDPEADAALSVADWHTCALDVNGTAYCWGGNARGQLGDGSTQSRNTPTAVPGLTFTSIATGGREFTCGIAVGGSAYCWGNGESGQIGNGLFEDASSPTLVTGGLSFRTIVAGYAHACAITTDSRTYCWGHGGNGRLGTGSNSDQPQPTEVSGGMTFRTIAANDHTCAITDQGVAHCWGDNGLGQLGDPTVASSSVPISVVTPLRFRSVATGLQHTCAVALDGTAHCWGRNDRGELGRGLTSSQEREAGAVVGGLLFKSLAAGFHQTCGVTVTNDGFCWGNNDFGQAGDGNTQFANGSPVAVSSGLSFATIGTGGQYGVAFGYTCGITTAGMAYCWGLGDAGQIGNGTGASGNPTVVSGGLTFAHVSASRSYGGHTCGVTTTETAYCWGENGSGQLGDNSTTDKSSPVPVNGSSSFQPTIAAGAHHTCAVTTTNVAYCWGHNGSGELGDGTTNQSSVPTVVTGGHAFDVITAGESHTCALDTGTAFCWGSNSNGQLGNGQPGADRLIPVQVTGGLVFQTITAGSRHTCGLTVDSLAYCWGGNDDGELGDGSAIDRSTPTPIPNRRFVVLETASEHTCGIVDTGSTFCWGWNGYGQIGDGGSQQRLQPSMVLGGFGFQTVTTGRHATCGLLSTGATYCWGGNELGEMGLGSPTKNRQFSPALVPNVSFASLTASDQLCGLDQAGAATCWGRNSHGQLGNGTVTRYNIPQLVSGGVTFKTGSP